MWSNGVLLHTYKDGFARIEGMLEDYAYYGLGLVELHQLTGEREHLDWANELLDVIVERFGDDEGRLLLRDGPPEARSCSSARSRASTRPRPAPAPRPPLLALMLQRYGLRGDGEAIAREVVASVQSLVLDAPTGFGATLQVIDLLAAPPRELAIVGAPEARAPFERVVAARLLPGLALAPATGPNGLPLLDGREAPAGGAAAWLCENMVCQLPAAAPAELNVQIDEIFPPIPDQHAEASP